MGYFDRVNFDISDTIMAVDALMRGLVGIENSPWKVADHLDIDGITGCYQQPCCCPIARFMLEALPHHRYHVDGDVMYVTTPDNVRITYTLPRGAVLFTRFFDEGRMLYLVDWTHMANHQPRTLALRNAS